MKVTVLDKQSMLDLAVQTSGSLEAVFDLADRNDLSVTDELPAGLELAEPEVLSKNIASYYSARQLYPATAISPDDSALLREGIEFWYVEYDFVVS